MTTRHLDRVLTVVDHAYATRDAAHRALTWLTGIPARIDTHYASACNRDDET